MRARVYFMRSGRLDFFRWTVEDGDLAALLWGDPQVTRFICASGRFSPEEIAQRLEREVENGARFGVQYWPVFLRETGELAGCCGLRPCPGEDWCFEIGAHFRPQFWGRGLAEEGTRAVLDFAFGALGARKIVAGHHPDNARSARLLARLGFVSVGEEFYEPTGRMHPSYEISAPPGETGR